MPPEIKEELKLWPNPAGQEVRAFAENPPPWITVPPGPTAIHPEVQAEVDRRHLHRGEAAAISLAKVLSKDGSMGVIVSDEVAVQLFLNYEQNSGRARELAAENAGGKKWHNFGAFAGIRPPGPNTPDNRIAATEDQRVFAFSTMNLISEGAERGRIADLKAEIARAKDVGLTPSDRSERLADQLDIHLRGQAQGNKENQQREQQEQERQQREQQERQKRLRDQEHSH